MWWFYTVAVCLLVQWRWSHSKIPPAPMDVWQDSETSHSKSSLGNFQHWYLPDTLASVYSYCVMVKSVSCCCVLGSCMGFLKSNHIFGRICKKGLILHASSSSNLSIRNSACVWPNTLKFGSRTFLSHHCAYTREHVKLNSLYSHMKLCAFKCGQLSAFIRLFLQIQSNNYNVCFFCHHVTHQTCWLPAGQAPWVYYL